MSDQINELSKNLVGKYVNAAQKDKHNFEKYVAARKKAGIGNDMDAKTAKSEIAKRKRGLKMADRKLSKEETEMEKENLQEAFDNLVDLAMNHKPLEFQQTFVDLMRDRIAGKVDAIKTDMKQYLFAKDPAEEGAGDHEVDIGPDGFVPDDNTEEDEPAVEEQLGKEEMPKSGDVADKIDAETKEKGQPKPTSKYWTDRQRELAKQLNQVGEEVIEEGPTRKHFQEVANTVRQIEDPDTRQAFANHHASIFAKQNPRFDHKKFHAACGTQS